MNPKWKKQQEAIKKVQIAFELNPDVDKRVRLEAARLGDSPSNVLRQVLGLDVKPPVRPRLGISLSDEEMRSLAQKLEIKADDRLALRRRALEAINRHYEELDENQS